MPDKKKPSNSNFDRAMVEIRRVENAVLRGVCEQEETNRLLGGIASALRPACRNIIHVVAVELKTQEIPMPPIDHMPDMQLPSSTVRAKLSVHNPRKADGTRATSPTWSSSDEAQVAIEAIDDANVQVADPAWVDPGDGTTAPLIDEVDAADGLPNVVYSTYANTPLDAGEATVTFKASGVADCDIKIKYSDPAVGHVAIVGVEAVEE